MNRLASPDLVEGLQSRRAQVRLRLALGAAVALSLGPSLGWTFVLAWLAAWYLVQAAEIAALGRILRRQRQGRPFRAAPPLLVVVATNLVFNLVAARAMLTGDPWLITAGVCLLTGALLNAVAMSRASTALFVAGVAPSALTGLLLLPVAMRGGATSSDLMAMGTSAGLLLVAAVVLRRLSLQAYLEARRASEAKGQFLATMSHEIRTPLNGVLGMAQVLRTEPLSESQRERVEIIQRSGQALLSLLNDVLDQSKIAAGKLELSPAPFDLERLLHDLQEVFGALCANKDVVLEVSAAPGLQGAWMGDALRIRQVVSNLLSNAVKFTDHGTVRLEARLEDTEVVLAVSDTGPGIPADQLERIFESFVQADAAVAGVYGGTGLGLSICRDLAALMGGAVAVSSVPGEGSTFTVRLPLARSEASLPPESPARALPAARPGLRVLAAEDHPVNRMVLQLLLGQLGLHTTVVEDGAKALEAWRAEPWDLLILDVQMPVLDGVTAARRIREAEALEGRPRTPIIALTGATLEHQVAVYTEWMDAVVAKPVELAQLAAAVSALAPPAEAARAA
jgi:signal transduction histidine kinase/ActR/RegA family two-component response regulator